MVTIRSIGFILCLWKKLCIIGVMKYKQHIIPDGLSRRMTGRDYVRELVRQRDNRTCQTCSKKWHVGQRRFDVHHLNGLCGKKSRGIDRIVDMGALTTLCHKCHFHHHQHSQVLSGNYHK